MTEPSSRSWLQWLALFAAVILYACLLQGARPLYSPDEGRYTAVALTMLQSGDWLHPHLHPEVALWSKPPLTYWAIASSFALLGHTEFAARLPGALAFAATILLLIRLGRRFVPAQPGLPALIYATFLFPSIAANLVTTDSLLALWETLQVVAFVEIWWGTEGARIRRGYGLLGVAAGLAFMTKGPPGLLVLGGCLAFAVWSERGRGLRRSMHWTTLLAFAVIGLSWFAVVTLQDQGILRYFLVEEVVNRVASDQTHRNGQWYGAFRIYLPTLLLGALPWLPFLLVNAWKERGRFRANLGHSAELRLLLCWIALPLSVFFLARSRLPLYVLPLFAPLALLTARAVVQLGLAPDRSSPRWHWAAIGLWCIALIALRLAPAFFQAPDDDKRLAAEIRAQLDPLPNEVAFVETGARYGLLFYLGSSIERLDLPEEPLRPLSEELVAELQVDEQCRLFAVEPDRLKDLIRALDEQKIAYRPLHNAGNYALIAQMTTDCAWGK